MHETAGLGAQGRKANQGDASDRRHQGNWAPIGLLARVGGRLEGCHAGEWVDIRWGDMVPSLVLLYYLSEKLAEC